MKRSTWAVSAVVLLLGTSALAAPSNEVETDAGVVAGTSAKTDGVRVFLGIPYAESPERSNRWRAPQPVKPWSRKLKAEEFAARCIQGGGGFGFGFGGRGGGGGRGMPAGGMGRGMGGPGMGGRGGGGGAPADEDCLYLNVWSGADSDDARLPVLVLMFGGDYAPGSTGTSDARYSGEALAGDGAIVVTFEHRLGALGFLAHPELSKESETGTSGNYGLLDSIAALQWVKRNIAAFGGDPDNVTAVGMGNGASIASALIASPLGDGLFGKAILQSGTWMSTPQQLGIGALRTLAEGEEMGAAFASRQQSDSLRSLRAMQAQQLAGAQSPGIIVDGYVLKEDPAVTFMAGRQRPVAVLVGSNKDEGMTFLQRLPNRQQSPDGFSETAQRFGPLVDRYVGLYPAGSPQEATLSYVGSISEELAWTMQMLAARQSARGAVSYAYLFTRSPPTTPGAQENVAARQAEIPYVLGNLSAPGASYTEGDKQLSEGMRAYWLSFAKTGKPVGPTPEWPEWPSIQSAGGAVMVLGDAIGSAEVLATPKVEFFEDAFRAIADSRTP